MKSSMDQSTWHDQKPSHRQRSQAEIAALHAETMAWDAVDHLMDQLISEPDEEKRDELYEAHRTATIMAQNAGESLRQIKRQI